MFIQSITHFDPATQKLVRRNWVRRGDTIKAIKAIADDVTAKEFTEAVRKDPERRAPWVSQSGNTVVMFEEKADRRDEWEPAEGKATASGTGSQKRVRCAVCQKESNAGGIAIHQKNSGHVGVEDVA